MSRAASDDVIPGQAAISVNDPGTDVPEGWTRVRLTGVARLESGHTPSRKHPEWWGGHVPWVSLPDAREHHGRVIHETTQTTNELGLANSAARWLPKDTVCLSRTASVGYVFRLGRPMATSQDFVNWVCSDALDPRFLMYALLAEGKHILNFGMGTTHTTIYFPAVLAFHLTLAPIAEQRRIIAQVEALLADVNKAKQRLDRVPLILKRFRQAVLAAACSGELTREWRTSEGPGWKSERLEDVCVSITDGDHQAPPQASSGIPFITISAINDGVLRLDRATRFVPTEYFESLKGERKAKPGDILYSVTGSIGIPAMVETPAPFVFQRHIAILKPDTRRISSRFLRHRLDAEDIRRQGLDVATGTAQLTIPLGGVRSFSFDLPSLQEQAEIVRRVDELFALADTIDRRLAAATARADKLPQAILSKAFSGDLVPTEAELARAEGRTYETAQQLLARLASAPPTASPRPGGRKGRAALK